MNQHVIDRIVLNLGGPEYVVSSHKLSIIQPIQNGRPFGKPKMECFSLKIVSDGDDSGLMEWGTESTKKHDGSIDFYSNGALVSQITFTGAYCTAYAQKGVYDLAVGKSSVIEKIELIPATLTWNDSTYESA